MKTILLTKGKVVLVDDEDFTYLNQWKWYWSNPGYAARRVGSKIILMHRQIMQTPQGMVTDHINHNTLDNRRSNLRVCTYQQNLRNAKISISNSSGYKGVTFVPKNSKGYEMKNKWRAILRFRAEDLKTKENRHHIHLGYFETKQEAAIAYNRAAVEHFGEFAWLNKLEDLHV